MDSRQRRNQDPSIDAFDYRNDTQKTFSARDKLVHVPPSDLVRIDDGMSNTVGESGVRNVFRQL